MISNTVQMLAAVARLVLFFQSLSTIPGWLLFIALPLKTSWKTPSTEVTLDEPTTHNLPATDGVVPQ